MKRILFLFNVLACSTLFAQEGSVGIGTQTPNEKAVLHLVAPNNDQGFLVPKLTTVQRNTFANELTTSENGMMVFDSDLNQFFFWLTDHWEAVGSSLQAGNGVEIVDGVISNTGDTNASDDFSGDWADLSNVPAAFSDDTDDVDDADADPTNELQDLNLAGDILTISGLATPTQIDLSAYTGTNTDEQDLLFSSGQISLSGDPDNTIIDLSAYDTDVSDDFSGDWADLQNIPVGFEDGTDDVDDADNDPTNEIELPLTAGTGEALKFDGANWVAATDETVDADSDPGNELQDLNLTSNILTITGIGSPTQINLASYLGTNTDEQNLQFLDGQITLTGDPDGTVIDLSLYDSDFTDDFTSEDESDPTVLASVKDGVDWSELSGIPSDFLDGIDNVDDADASITNELQDLVYDSRGFLLSLTGSSGDPVNLSALLDNTDVLADLSPLEGQIPKFVEGSWQVVMDEFEDADADPGNEFQDLIYDSKSNQLTITNSSGLPIDLSYLLDNTDVLSTLDPGEGMIPKYSKGVWTVMPDNVDDADADPGNEIQDLSFDGESSLRITNNASATDIDLSTFYDNTDLLAEMLVSEGQIAKYSLGSWGPAEDEVDDADADPLNELQSLQFEGTAMWLSRDPEGNSIDLSIYNTDALADLLPSEGQIAKYSLGNWVPAQDEVDDADADPINEIQDLFYDSRGFTLSITNNSDATPIDLSGLRNTDEQDLELVDGSLELTNDGTPVNLNAYLDNTDMLAGLPGSNGQVVKHNGITWVADTDEVDDADNDPNNEMEFPEFAELGQVMKFTDAGTWEPGSDLINDADSDPDNENQTVTAGTGISVSQTGQNFQITNSSPDRTVNITGSGNASVSGTYPNFTINVPTSSSDQYAFKAGARNELTVPAEGLPVKLTFDAVSYDIGEIYTTLDFMAPLNGIYNFTGTITTQIGGGGDFYLYLLKNGKDVVHAMDVTVAAQDVISFMTDIQLVKGDIVSVFISSTRGGTVVGDPIQTNLSGRLVLSNQ